MGHQYPYCDTAHGACRSQHQGRVRPSTRRRRAGSSGGKRAGWTSPCPCQCKSKLNGPRNVGVADDGSSSIELRDVVFRYSDGPVLLGNGDGVLVRDSLFEWNDWTAVGGSWPVGVPRFGKANRGTSMRINGNNLVYQRLTFANNGAAQSFSAGGVGGASPRVEDCYFSKQLSIQDDGSFVEGGGVPATVYLRNWCTDTGKSGLRWDGYYPEKKDLGGLMLDNVVWNASGVVVKGDQHNVSGNTIFDAADITENSAASFFGFCLLVWDACNICHM